MATYKTPGVYIKEVSLFPPSVAEVATAIPAFIGYTERADEKGVDLTNVPTEVESMVEFEELFGGAPSPGSITVTLDDTNAPTLVDIVPRYYLYNSLQLFFRNGGGKCYIVSVGDYETAVALGDPANPGATPGLLVGLDRLKKYDEPTIIVAPDSILLATTDLYALQQQALAQCASLQDRFAVFDLHERRGGVPTFDWEEGVDEFRNQIGINNLKYGAAYVPHLRTSIPYAFEYSDIDLQRSGGAALPLATISANPASVNRLDTVVADRTIIDDFVDDPVGDGSSLSEGFSDIATTGEQEIRDKVTYLDEVAQAFRALTFADADLSTAHDALVDPGGDLESIVESLLQHDVDYFANDRTANPLGIVSDADYAGYTTLAAVAAQSPEDTIYETASTPGATETDRAGNARDDFKGLYDRLAAAIHTIQEAAQNRVETLEQEVKDTNAIYANIVRAIENEGSVLPPSGAIAGVYAYVDRTRGVWKAPANVSLSSVVGPTFQIDHADQEDLNVDSNGGKSVNAIRSFSGRGTLVWGARTLAGNSNEWRYVNVRRFFNMAEESIKKSTSWAVFEPNDATLWTKVKGMVDNYLIQKWQEGALAGAKPDEAFFVQVGLGLTMTPQDILEGRLKVKVGMAVARPAEFIIFEFMHKLQES